jgi:hypothetical protein
MTVTTRFGRTVKKPVLYVPPEEVLEDDYASDEHDSVIDSDIDTEDEEEYSSDEDDYDDDADENGNLKDFVVDDESESEEEDA